jgi:hypothetical protein
VTEEEFRYDSILSPFAFLLPRSRDDLFVAKRGSFARLADARSMLLRCEKDRAVCGTLENGVTE